MPLISLSAVTPNTEMTRILFTALAQPAGPEAARGEETLRGVGRFDGLETTSTATTVREVGINKTEWQASNA